MAKGFDFFVGCGCYKKKLIYNKDELQEIIPNFGDLN